jgi:hypothetical protein
MVSVCSSVISRLLLWRTNTQNSADHAGTLYLNRDG